MGALKGRFGCLQGLCMNIQDAKDHNMACRWITICIILHNLCIEVEGMWITTHVQSIYNYL
jgi:hypothetical protein